MLDLRALMSLFYLQTEGKRAFTVVRVWEGYGPTSLCNNTFSFKRVEIDLEQLKRIATIDKTNYFSFH
jgi:hypothetical protein